VPRSCHPTPVSVQRELLHVHAGEFVQLRHFDQRLDCRMAAGVEVDDFGGSW